MVDRQPQSPEEPPPTVWWRVLNCPVGQTLCWEIGPFSLWVTRYESEWRLAHDRAAYEDERAIEWRVAYDISRPTDSALEERYIFGRTESRLSVVPVLADRPVVTRPHTPFNIPAGRDATVYVSSPLWVRLQVHEPAIVLQDLPILRPSDTWFGSSTLEGEICYATRTSARLHLEEVPHRPHRAVTPVMIRNRAPNNLFLERLSIPVPYLALYADRDGLLWTESITLIREAETEMAGVRIAEERLEPTEGFVRLTEPRQKLETGVLFRAFSSIFR